MFSAIIIDGSRDDNRVWDHLLSGCRLFLYKVEDRLKKYLYLESKTCFNLQYIGVLVMERARATY